MVVERPDHDEEIELHLPYWMVKHIRGNAVHSKNTAYSEYGREDAQKIISLLDYQLEQHMKDGSE